MSIHHQHRHQFFVTKPAQLVAQIGLLPQAAHTCQPLVPYVREIVLLKQNLTLKPEAAHLYAQGLAVAQPPALHLQHGQQLALKVVVHHLRHLRPLRRLPLHLAVEAAVMFAEYLVQQEVDAVKVSGLLPEKGKPALAHELGYTSVFRGQIQVYVVAAVVYAMAL